MKKAILKTLAYADIFSFPLGRDGLWQFLIWGKSQKPYKNKFSKDLKILLKKKIIGKKNNLFYLKNRENLVTRRKNLEKVNQEKLKRAQEFVKRIKFIPWLKGVLITGALAVGNAKKHDDIDLFIITSSKRLWLTRFLCVLLTEFLGIRRRPNQKKIKNKICLNLFLSEDNLRISIKRQNLFTAHEVVQAKPVLERDKVHKKFLETNSWVKTYLPNSVKIKNLKFKLSSRTQVEEMKNYSFLNHLVTGSLNHLERLIFLIQKKYMSSRRTREEISLSKAFFHPVNRKKRVLACYTRKIQSLGV